MGNRIDPATGYGNGGLRYMLAIEHNGHAVQTCRTLDTLVQITGNMDTPGGNRGATRSPVEGGHAGFGSNAPGCPPMPEENRLARLGSERFPLLRWFNSWADANTVWEAMTTGEPYPVVMAMNSSGDFMCQGNTTYNWEAPARSGLYVRSESVAASVSGHGGHSCSRPALAGDSRMPARIPGFSWCYGSACPLHRADRREHLRPDDSCELP